MEKIDIIKDIEQLFPSEFKDATILFKDTYVPLYDFLEHDFIKFVRDNANVEDLVKYIRNNLSTRIRLKSVEDFISGNKMFIDVIQISQDEVTSVREFLNSYCVQNMTSEGKINYPPNRTVEIEELYKKVLENTYYGPTIQDKAELCINLAHYIDKEILDSIMDGMDITVWDYITKVIPTMMSSISVVSIKDEKGDREIDVEKFVVQIVDHQAKYLSDKKAKEKEDLENKYNKTSDNPGLVSEIQVKLEEDKTLTVTAEIPVLNSSLLTDEEKNSLLNNYVKMESITNEEYLSTELNRIKIAIDNANTAHDLDSISSFFKTIISSINRENTSSHINQLIISIDELIISKRNNLIKVSGNQEYYTDALFSEINRMREELSGFTTLDQFSSLYGCALDRYEEVLNKGIKDIQLKSSFAQLFKLINEKRLNLDATMADQPPEVERAKVDLNALITDIKKDVLTIEHDANNLGNLTGTEIRLNLNIQKAKEQVERAYIDGLLTEDDREYYMYRLKNFSMAIQSETKIGFGKN
ncbi:MAG: hypothetical protein J1F35_07235 [Erysipelotrichales bacterium]|nr:hypothetical protein [Erysipelotrichales bacterium]